MELLRSQANVLFDFIERESLSPSLFTISGYGDPRNRGTRISHKSSQYYFNIRARDAGGFNCQYSPSHDRLVSSDHYPTQWQDAIELYISWLRVLKRETEMVDKWQQLQEGTPNFKLVESNNDGKFSYEEVLQIETKVRLLKEKVKQIPLTSDQAKVLNEKLDYCIELAKTANKFDWAGYFIGIITTIILTLAVTPENAKLVWEAVKQVFTGFLLM